MTFLLPGFAEFEVEREKSGKSRGDLAFPNPVVSLPKAYHAGSFANTTTYTTELKDSATLEALKRLKLYVESK